MLLLLDGASKTLDDPTAQGNGRTIANADLEDILYLCCSSHARVIVCSLGKIAIACHLSVCKPFVDHPPGISSVTPGHSQCSRWHQGAFCAHRAVRPD